MGAVPEYVTTLQELGLTMIHAVSKAYEKPVLEVKDIVALAARSGEQVNGTLAKEKQLNIAIRLCDKPKNLKVQNTIFSKLLLIPQ